MAPSLAEVRKLALALTTDDTKLNNAATLSALLVESRDEARLCTALVGLQTFFVATKTAQRRGVSEIEGTASQKFADWLRKTFTLFMTRICALLSDIDLPEGVRLEALRTGLECSRAGEAGGIDSGAVQSLFMAVARGCALTDGVRTLIQSVCVRYGDLRYSAYCAIRRACEEDAASAAIAPAGPAAEERAAAAARRRCFYGVLCAAPFAMPGAEPPAGDEDAAPPFCNWGGWAVPDAVAAGGIKRKRKDAAPAAGAGAGAAAAAGKMPKWADPAAHRRAFGEAWVALLRLELPRDCYKAALVHIPQAVMVHMPNPLMLSDFLSRAVGMGELLGILALNGLFILMTQHGLEYPQFYVRLYGMMEPGLLHSRHRKRVLELTDVFLKSTYLPAYLAAAFAKRLARLSLSAPPAGAITAIAVAHNLLRRHPGCGVLVHREPHRPSVGPLKSTGDAAESVGGDADEDGDGRAEALGAGGDPYLEQEADPAKCRAIQSSLWEFDALRHHYCPQVARFAAVLEKDLTNKSKTIELDLAALLEGSYQTLFAAEVGRRAKEVPLMVYAAAEMPRGLLEGLGAEPAFAGWEGSWTAQGGEEARADDDGA